MNADHPSGLRAGAGPVAPRHPPFAVFAVPIPAARYRSTEGQNGASRGAPAPAEGTTRGRTSTGHGRRGFCEIAQRPSRRGRLLSPGSARAGARPGEGRAQVSADVVFAKLRNDPLADPPSRRGRLLLSGSARAGARPGEGRAQVAAAALFLRNRATTLALRRCRLLPPGSARAGHVPGKDGHRSRRTWFLRNRATTLPPGQAPPAGLGTAGGTTRGRTGTARGGRGFCEIAQRPSRRDRLLPPGSTRRGRGHVPEKDGHRSRRPRFFCEIAQRPWPPPGQAPPAGLGAGGGMIRGGTGTGRGGRGFCEIAQQPSRRGRLLSPGSTRAGARPGEGRAQVAADMVFAKSRNDPPAGAGSSRRVRHGRGHDPGKDGRRSRRTWFLRNRATTLPPGQAPPGGFDPGRGTTRGRTGTGRGGRSFCEIAQQPSRRGRLLPPGSARAGFREMRNDPRGRCERVCATQQSGTGLVAATSGLGLWGRAPSPSSLRASTSPAKRGRGEYGSATTLPPGQAPPGGFGTDGFSRNAQRPSGQVRESVRDATVRHRPGGCYERAGSLGPRTLTLVASRLDLSRKARER